MRGKDLAETSFPAFVPEEYPDLPKSGDDLIGIQAFPFTVGGSFFSGLNFTGFSST
jgi:hypothetical protein